MSGSVGGLPWPATPTPGAVGPGLAGVAPAGPPTDLVTRFGAGLGAVLAVVAAAVLASAVRGRRVDARRADVADSVRRGLQARLGADAPDWASWVADLSAVERTVLEAELVDHAAFVDGAYRTELLAAARALGVGERAKRTVESGPGHERRRALTTLVALSFPVESAWLRDVEPATRAEREAVGYLLGVDPDPEDRRVGVDLLLSGESLSVFGVHALYRLVETDPAVLLERLDRDPVLAPEPAAGALLALGATDPVTRSVPLSGVLFYLVHPEATVRRRACAVLAAYGWRRDVRERVPLWALFDDDDPDVRLAAYRLLASWGDERATSRLRRALHREPDDRVRRLGRRSLAAALDRQEPPDGPHGVDAGRVERVTDLLL